MIHNKKPIGVIGAMQVEIEAILAAGEITAREEHASMTFTRLTLRGVPCVVAQCHAGKVNSAACAQVMASVYAPRIILNIGVAGGTGPQVQIGDLVIASHCVQYDYDLTPMGDALSVIEVPGSGKLSRFPCDGALVEKLRAAAQGLYGAAHVGPIATGDKFVADPAFGAYLYETFGALACEMEGASTAHVCAMNRIPCAVLRAISDGANHDSQVDFPTFAAESAHRAQQLLVKVIPAL